jgi:hypothetical protein
MLQEATGRVVGLRKEKLPSNQALATIPPTLTENTNSSLEEWNTGCFELLPNFFAQIVHHLFQSSLLSREAIDRLDAVGQIET